MNSCLSNFRYRPVQELTVFDDHTTDLALPERSTIQEIAHE